MTISKTPFRSYGRSLTLANFKHIIAEQLLPYDLEQYNKGCPTPLNITDVIDECMQTAEKYYNAIASIPAGSFYSCRDGATFTPPADLSQKSIDDFCSNHHGGSISYKKHDGFACIDFQYYIQTTHARCKLADRHIYIPWVFDGKGLILLDTETDYSDPALVMNEEQLRDHIATNYHRWKAFATMAGKQTRGFEIYMARAEGKNLGFIPATAFKRIDSCRQLTDFAVRFLTEQEQGAPYSEEAYLRNLKATTRHRY